ncbi:MAG: hypothetical protein FP833_12110 [Atribacteria sp.]|nr:hypothetical protein [Candidatus Atribacteria bacterium]
MKDSVEFKRLIEKIFDSYESKVKMVTSLMRQVHQKIIKYQNEQDLMINRLRDILANNEFLRKKDFDLMIAEINNDKKTREREISQTVEEFCTEEEKIVAELKEILTLKSTSILEDFTIVKNKILSRSTENREKRISRMLKDFHRDLEEINTALRMLLEKGSSVKIRDFKAMLKAFRIERKNGRLKIDEILNEFEKVKDEIDDEWSMVMANVR